MADNVELNAGSGGATLAADDISGIHHQRVKVQFGSDGNATDVSDTDALPVRTKFVTSLPAAVDPSSMKLVELTKDNDGTTWNGAVDYSGTAARFALEAPTNKRYLVTGLTINLYDADTGGTERHITDDDILGVSISNGITVTHRNIADDSIVDTVVGATRPIVRNQDFLRFGDLKEFYNDTVSGTEKASATFFIDFLKSGGGVDIYTSGVSVGGYLCVDLNDNFSSLTQVTFTAHCALFTEAEFTAYQGGEVGA